MSTKIVYTPNYTVVGSPTISSEYVASGFSTSNYLSIGNGFNPGSATFEIFLDFTTGSSLTNQAIFDTCRSEKYGILICLLNSKIFVSAGNGSWIIDGGSYAPTTNTHYYVKFVFTGSQYALMVSTDGETWTDSIRVNSSSTLNFSNEPRLGYSQRTSWGFSGSMNLLNCYININGEKYWEAVTVTEVDTSGSIDISKGYYNDGTHTIIMPEGQHYLSDLTTGQTLGGKNNLFATSYNDVAKPVMSSLNAPTGTYDVYVDLEHPVYLSYAKNYIAGDKLMSGVAWTFEKGGSIITDYTVVGSPTISSDYILSGTSNSNYVKSTTTTPSSITTFDFITKYTKTESSSNLAYIFCDVASNAILYSQSQNKIGWYDSNDGDVVGTTAMSLNTTYWVRMKIEDTTMRLYSLEDNNYTLSTLPDISNWTLEATKTNFTKARLQSKTLDLGANPTTGNYGLRGTLDMKETIFTINGEVWWSPVDVTIASVSAPKSLLYNTTQDSTYWLPSAQTVLLSSLTSSDLLTRNNLYLTNTTGSDVSAFTFRKNAPSTTEYWQQPEYVYLTQDKTHILGVGTEPDEIVLEAIAGTFTANYSVIGTISVNDQHEATGFSTSNYLQLPETFNPGTSDFEIVIACNPTGSSSSYVLAGTANSTHAIIPNATTYLSAGGGTYNISLSKNNSIGYNVKQYIKITRVGNTFTRYCSTDGTNWTQESTATNSGSMNSATLNIGFYGYETNKSFLGTVYLDECYIKVNGLYWWQPYTGNLDTVSVSSEHYWSYYGLPSNPRAGSITVGYRVYGDIVNPKNLPKKASQLPTTGTIGTTCKLLMTCGLALYGGGNLTMHEDNLQRSADSASYYYTGYTITFTDTTHAEIQSLVKTGTKVRIYAGISDSSLSPKEVSCLAVTKEQYNAGIPENTNLKYSKEENSNVAFPCEMTNQVTVGSGLTYDSSTDTFSNTGSAISQNTFTLKYMGDFYVDI